MSTEDINPYAPPEEGEQEFFKERLCLTDANLAVRGMMHSKVIRLTEQSLYIGKVTVAVQDIVWWSERLVKGLLFKRYGVRVLLITGEGQVEDYYLSPLSLSGVQSPKKIEALIEAITRAGARKSEIRPPEEPSRIRDLLILLQLPFRRTLSAPCRIFFALASFGLLTPFVQIGIGLAGEIPVLLLIAVLILIFSPMVISLYLWLVRNLARGMFPDETEAIWGDSRMQG